MEKKNQKKWVGLLLKPRKILEFFKIYLYAKYGAFCFNTKKRSFLQVRTMMEATPPYSPETTTRSKDF